MTGCEAFPHVKDEDLAAAFEVFRRSIKQLVGPDHPFYMVVGLWTVDGLTSATSCANVQDAVTILESMAEDMRGRIGERVIDMETKQ